MSSSNKAFNCVMNLTLGGSIDIITATLTTTAVPSMANENTSESFCMRGGQGHRESIHPMTTRQKALMMTRNAVLNTTELVEAILLDVTPEDLLRCRRVRSSWNDLIMHSPRLRRKLFLDVEKGSRPMGDKQVFDKATHIWRPLFCADVRDHGRDWHKRQRRVHPCVLNPLIFRQEPPVPASQKSSKRVGQRCESVYFLRRPDVARLSRPRDLGGSIIGDMFVCQPPISEVEVELHYQEVALRPMTDGNMCLRWQARKRFKVVNHSGTRVGDIARELVDIMGGISEDFKLSVVVESHLRKKSTIRMSGALLISP